MGFKGIRDQVAGFEFRVWDFGGGVVEAFHERTPLSLSGRCRYFSAARTCDRAALKGL